MLANMCWQPAVSIPGGMTSSGLPIGLQVVGRRFEESLLLQLARVMERTHPWPLTAPRAVEPGN
jgi:aspartyl-tRNA(Asn)/glutamyl-tRNA(Gln) amidotransferase subunit A